jgi:hypothetical protein
LNIVKEPNFYNQSKPLTKGMRELGGYRRRAYLPTMNGGISRAQDE